MRVCSGMIASRFTTLNQLWEGSSQPPCVMTVSVIPSLFSMVVIGDLTKMMASYRVATCIRR